MEVFQCCKDYATPVVQKFMVVWGVEVYGLCRP